jgi:hypothetical protein
VRLACLNHAASVQAEPGSNSSIVYRGPQRSSCPLHITLRRREQDLMVSRCGLSSTKNLSTCRPPDQTSRILQQVVTAPPPAKAGRVSRVSIQPTGTSPVSQTNTRCKAQNIFWPPRDANLEAILTQINDFRHRRKRRRRRDHFLACTAKTF